MRFPTKWLTYKSRVRADLDQLYKTENGPSFFDDKYITALTVSAKLLEGWEIRMLLFQLGLSVFIVMGLISSDASISLLGISLKQMTGLKELLLALSATLAVLFYAISQSKMLRLIVIEKLTELRTDEKYLSFAKLAAPAAYEMTPYVAKQYDKWMFPTILAKSTTFAMAVLSLIFGLLLFGFSIGLWIYLYVDILRQPALGLWSYLTIVYSSVAYALCFLWFVRAYLPLPFRDMRALQGLEALRGTDPAGHARRLEEIYGDK